jgi:triacylglycerol lipase
MNETTEPVTPQHFAEKIRAMGRGLSPTLFTDTLKLCGEVQKSAPGGVERIDDIAFGSHQLQSLDVYLPHYLPPAKGNEKAPVVLFIHGGGFTGGARNLKRGSFYGNITTFFARNGVLGLNASYRLAPEFKYPEGALDIGRALAWARENVAQYGGDPDRIFIFGHSSGASHLATYALHKAYQPQGGLPVAGLILMSGLYGPDMELGDKRQIAYYGEDTSRYPEMSAIRNLGPASMPIYILFSEYDGYPFQKAGLDLAREVAERDQDCPWFTLVHRHNHMSQLLSINSEVDPVGPDLLAFIEAH